MKKKKIGTLSLPRHPLTGHPTLNASSDIFYNGFEDYCKKIIRLPDKFHPIDICLCNRMYERAIPICEKYKLSYVLSGKGDSLFLYRLQSFYSKYEYVTSYTGNPMWFALWWGNKFFHLTEDDIGPMYPDISKNSFSISNAETSREEYKKYVDLDRYLGFSFKKTKEELSLLMDKCKEDINYKLWMEVYRQNGDIYFMHKIRKKVFHI